MKSYEIQMLKVMFDSDLVEIYKNKNKESKGFEPLEAFTSLNYKFSALILSANSPKNDCT